MNETRILVTGGSGVIGQELIQLLTDGGAVVKSVDKEPYPANGVDNVDSIQIDLATDDLDPIRAFKPEVVFHLAAVFERTEESASFWEDNWRDNILASHRLAHALQGIDALETVVFASSYLVYDPDIYLSPIPGDRPTLIDEESAVDPRNLCGAAKYYTEKELAFLTETEDVRVISPRIFRVYGRGSKDIISRWVRRGLRDKTLTIYNEKNLFDFIYAQDVAEGLFRLSKAEDAKGPVNLGRGISSTVSEVLSVLTDEIPGVEGNVDIDGVQELYETSCADISRLVELTGWRPEYDLEAGIHDVIEHEREQMN